MREEVVTLGRNASLVGIVTPPADARGNENLPALLLLNAGMLHRVGPNRLYVRMAQDLARLGFLVLRFDFSGIGDSEPRDDANPLETRWLGEVREAMDDLSAARRIGRFGLIGICSGATLSFKTACADSRVAGALLINPLDHLHDGTDAALDSEIRTRIAARHNWRMALGSSVSGKQWLKALRGDVNYRSIARLLGFQLRTLFGGRPASASEKNEIEASFNRLSKQGVRVLHVYSEGDVALDYLELMVGDRKELLRASGGLNVEIVPGSNHSFTLLENQEDLLGTARRWARALVRD